MKGAGRWNGQVWGGAGVGTEGQVSNSSFQEECSINRSPQVGRSLTRNGKSFLFIEHKALCDRPAQQPDLPDSSSYQLLFVGLTTHLKQNTPILGNSTARSFLMLQPSANLTHTRT